MALPALKSFSDCASWELTVGPYIPQLYNLPEKLLEVVQGRQGLANLYTETNPLISGFAISLLLGLVFLIVSEINQNFSQVDRCWSLLPTLYLAHFDLWARLAGVPSQRLDALLLFGLAWSTRLTFNYWRRGGYSVGSEDYRWEIIRARIPTWAFKILNVVFISFIQSILLFLLAAPAYPILLSTQFRPEVGLSDVTFVVLELGLVIIEWFADQQQWNYQNAKYAYRKTAKLPAGWAADDLNRGFNTHGLWAYSRHPAFAAEQTIWTLLYVWSAITTSTPLFWAAAGALNLIITIFSGSTILTESITAQKYPEYAEYQRQVGKFLPWGFAPYQPPAATASKPAAGVAKGKKKQK